MCCRPVKHAMSVCVCSPPSLRKEFSAFHCFKLHLHGPRGSGHFRTAATQVELSPQALQQASLVPTPCTYSCDAGLIHVPGM
eukprot:COSAG02_NODE_64_length_43111_cov_35.627709_24_plen_82_part_00